MVKLTLIHITDPHWISRNWNLPHSDEMEWQTQDYDALSAAFKQLSQTSEFKAHFGDTNVLIHTGDSVNFYKFYREVPIDKQFEEISSKLLPLIESCGTFDLKLAVPGNHDVSRSVASGKIISVAGNSITCEFLREHYSKSAFDSNLKMRPHYFELNAHEFVNTNPHVRKKLIDIVDNTESSFILKTECPFEVGETFVVYPKDRFFDFCKTFHENGWITPFALKSFSIALDAGGKRIRLWLVNSCDRCGLDSLPDGTQLDLVEIKDQHIRNWSDDVRQNGSDDDLRIAIMHHTPVPNYGSRNARVKRDVFVNNSDFNAELIRSNVKLVLSGHQHLGDVVYAAMPEDSEKRINNQLPPLIESGFLSICGPSFLRKEKEGSPGFSAIEIHFRQDTCVGEIHLTRYNYNRRARRFDINTFQYNIAFRALVDIHPKKEHLRRHRVLESAISYTYSRQAIEPLERVLIKRTPMPELDKWFELYDQFRTGYPHLLFGLYSISVLTPATWWSMELTRRFRPSFLDHAKSRDRFARSIDYSSGLPNVGYSASVLGAIAKSVENGARLSVEEVVRNVTRKDLSHEDDRFMRDMIKNDPTTLVAIASVPHALDSILGRNRFGVTVRGLEDRATWDIPLKESDEDRDSRPVEQYEVARIALWPFNYFDSDYALRIIEFHQDFAVPLFWLHPDRMIGSDGKPRRHFGAYYLGAKGSPVARGLSYVNNYTGGKITAEDFEDDVQGDSLMAQLWGPDNIPKALQSNVHSLPSEISYLLRRPDILFACDAYAITRAGGIEGLKAFLDERSERAAAWANDADYTQ